MRRAARDDAGTAMAEMAQGAAVLVERRRRGGLAEALDVALSGDDPDTITRRAMGVAVAGTRTWDASAALHLEAYRRATDAAGG